MRRQLKHVLLFLTFVLCLTAFTSASARADTASQENTDGGNTYQTNSGAQVTIPVVDTSGSTIYDYADLLSAEEEAALSEKMASVGEKRKLQLVILTSTEIPQDVNYGMTTTKQYAEQFYIDNDFQEDCVIFTIDMNNRVLWTTGHGRFATESFVKTEETIYNHTMEKARNADYSGAADVFIRDVYRYKNVAWALMPTIPSVIVSVLGALAAVVALLAKHGTSQPNKLNVPKLRITGYQSTKHDVRYMGTTRTVRHIPRPSRSSGGGGFSGGVSSGGGFSGGGGGFSGGGGHF
jgi:uncharacterized protein